MYNMTFTLNSPITEEQWDMLEDVDFDYTNEITFHTKHGKEVKFVKSSAQPERKKGKWLKSYADHEIFGIRPFFRYCSACNESTVYAYKYCPHCGADMRGEEGEEHE